MKTYEDDSPFTSSSLSEPLAFLNVVRGEHRTDPVRVRRPNLSSQSRRELACPILFQAMHSIHQVKSRQIDLPYELAFPQSPNAAQPIEAHRESRQSAANLLVCRALRSSLIVSAYQKRLVCV